MRKQLLFRVERIELHFPARQHLDAECTNIVCALDEHKSVCRVDHFVNDSSPVMVAIHAALQNCGLAQFRVRACHVIRADSTFSRQITARDSVHEDGDNVLFVLLRASGNAKALISINSQARLSQNEISKACSVLIDDNVCVIYPPNVVYSLGQSSTVFLHATCSSGAVPSIQVYDQVRFACPYNPTLRHGDVRMIPKRYQPNDSGACIYTALSWKNVLDHLAVCRFNPDQNRHEKREKKQRANRVVAICDLCDHPPFNSKNSLMKHKSRKHAKLIEAPCQDGDLPKSSPTPTLLDQLNFIISDTESSSRNVPLSAISTYRLIDDMLATISRSDVAQPSGLMHHNAGEVSMIGISCILQSVGELGSNDVFLDLGAGVGNVIFQVALQTDVRSCIGVEMRGELTRITQSLLDDQPHPRLHKVSMYNIEVTPQNILEIPGVEDVTHVFSHNLLFSESTHFALEELCWLPKVVWIAVSRPPCSRHSARCQKGFCRYWSLRCVPSVPVTYADSLVKFYVYTREVV